MTFKEGTFPRFFKEVNNIFFPGEKYFARTISTKTIFIFRENGQKKSLL